MDLTNDDRLRSLLQQVAGNQCSVDVALESLRTLPYENLGFARLDHHRSIRRGYPEVIFAAGKTPEQVATIFAHMAAVSPRVLATRANAEHAAAVLASTAEAIFDPVSRTIRLDREPDRPRRTGVAVVAAGTSDLPISEEAAITLDLLGHAPLRITDVGVAGIHRLLDQLPTLRQARVLIVVAGMEGALPSVVAGLVRAPVVAVPTSVGYGASFGGLAALLGMLNSCSPGIAVVNIDNGFGAAYMAAQINEIGNPAPKA